MAKTKKQQLGKSGDELKAVISDLRKELAKLSMENAKRQLKQTTQIRTKRDELARALTSLNMVKYIADDNKKEETK